MGTRHVADAKWQLSGTRASRHGKRWSVDVDASRPDEGLRNVRMDGLVVGQLQPLQLSISPTARPQVCETYVRGNDLVARYSPGAIDRIESQVYWRMVDDDIGLLQLIVAAKTDRLDSRPRMSTRTRMSEGQVFCPASAGWAWRELREDFASEEGKSQPPVMVFRPRSGDISYVEMAYPSDVRRWQLSLDSSATDVWTCEFELFHEFLEKGVIRISRVQAAIVPRADDFRRAEDDYRQFVSQPPPLTT